MPDARNSPPAPPGRAPSPSRSSPPDTVKPPFLQLLTAHRVLLCTHCRSCYTRRNIDYHLRAVHRITGAAKRQALAWLDVQDVVDSESEVVNPPPGGPPVSGLPTYPGYACSSVDCQYSTTSAQLMRKHASAQHGRRQGRSPQRASPVTLQAFFARSCRYFLVSNINVGHPRPDLGRAPTSIARQNLDGRYEVALSQLSRPQSELEVQHVSEITPWLRVTNFHTHTAKFGDVDDFRDVLRLPRRQEDVSLSLVCESVDRVIRRGLDRLQNDRAGTRLHRLDAQLLNSFQAGATSQHPLPRLDRDHSVKTYSRLFQQLVCYFFRVEDDHFDGPVFQVTDRQRQASIELLEEAMRQAGDVEAHEHHEELAAAHGAPPASDDEDGDTPPPARRDPDLARERGHRRQARAVRREAHQRAEVVRLDALTLTFCVTLIQHRLQDSSFESAMLSFCAVLAWDSSARAWRKDLGNYRSYLSQLIYVSQLLILLHCDSLVLHGQHGDLGEAITAQRDLWLQNTSRGPIGDIQAWRLYARSVARDTVGVAQVRWHQDGRTLVYRDVTYSVSFLYDEVRYCLQGAARILSEDLLLNVEDPPVYRVEDLVDNWDGSSPFQSFIDDPRNADHLDGGHDWLYRQILSSPTLTDRVLQADADGQWLVRPDAAHQYEMAVQHFLELMLTVIHKGSGQPARRPEMLGLRWQNTAYDRRNLFIHDGYVLFILTYHKSQNQAHASRYPVRFLLPEAGRLLVQFLVLVQPFRRWLSRETHIPDRVTEYLWSDSKGVWSDDRMTRLIKRNSLLSVGVTTHVQAWRQLAVGIAIKWFAGLAYQADLDLHGDADDDQGGHPMLISAGEVPAVVHHQAAHAPRTGNQMYGGTINFKDGLTDAGLQQYLFASQVWHQLCEQPFGGRDPAPSTTPRRPAHGRTTGPVHPTPPLRSSPLTSSSLGPQTRKRGRAVSPSSPSPLAKRLAFRQTPSRHRLYWTDAAAQTALQSLFGPEARYRSPAQEQMIKQIVAGRGEVVAALATSEGKSLAFMLPCRLARAGTTVVILPLVVLKQDMFRRCTELGLTFSVWDRHQDPWSCASCPLVFVSAEAAVQTPFRAFLAGLDAREALDRVVFDESHLVLTASDYRPKLRLMQNLRTLRCQFVFLSATIPPILQPTFSHRLLLWDPCIIRSESTFRRDLRYSVAWARADPHRTFIQQAVQGIQGTLEQPPIGDDVTARVIVYVLSRRVADEIATALGVDAYYSDSGTTDEKAAMLSRWLEGRHRVIVATSAFGMGVDYPRVAAVIHIGAPTSAIDFAQEIGRLGRDGRGGQSTIVLPQEPGTTGEDETDESLLPVEQQAMRTYLHHPRCHAAALSWFLDGRPWYCAAEAAQQQCSRCRRLGRWRAEAETDEVPQWLSARQQRRLAIDDDRVVPDELVSVSSAGEEEIQSPALVRQHVRDSARGRQRYVHQLEQFRGCCFICRLLGDGVGVGLDTWHSLDRCLHRGRQEFHEAKQQAIQRGQARRGWLAAYAACFQCGNPQEVCPVGRPEGCMFRDTVLPAAWAFFRVARPFGRTLADWTGRSFPSEAAWMQWVGEERTVHGMRATNAMWITQIVLNQLAPV